MTIIHFPGQKEGEKISFLVRKHWIIYVKLMLFIVAMIGIPLALYAFVEATSEMSRATSQIVTLIFLLYLDFMLLITYIRWMEEELDVLIVTSERLISIEQISFMHRTVSETELSQIQDVRNVSKGVLSNVLGFGLLLVQTAAEKVVFEIKDVDDPYDVSRSIMDLCNHYKREMAAQRNGVQSEKI